MRKSSQCSCKLITGLVLLAAGLFFLGCAKTGLKAEVQTPREMFEAKCSFCHALNKALAQPHTQAGWIKLVDRCAKKRFWFISSEERRQIATYLFQVRPAAEEPPPKTPKPIAVEFTKENRGPR